LGKISRILFSIFILAGIILAYWGYTSLKNNKQPNVKALSLIPDSCELLICIDDFSEFSGELRYKNLLWQDLSQLNALSGLEEKMQLFDSLLRIDPVLTELSTSNSIYIAVYPNKKFIVAFNVKELSGQTSLKTSLENFKNTLSVCGMTAEVDRGAGAISNSPELLKKFFEPKKSSVENNPDFSTFKKATHYSGISLFVNKNGEELKRSWVNLSIKPDRIVLNGLKKIDTSVFCGNVAADPVRGMDILERIPLICNAFELFATNDAEDIFNGSEANDWWKRASDSSLFMAKLEFYKCIGSQMAKVMMPSKKEALVISLKDSTKFAEILSFMRDSLGAPGTIYKLYSGDFAGATFPQLKIKQLDHVAVFADHLVFTSGQSDAQVFVNANENGSSILDNTRFKQYALRNFNTEFHHITYKLLSSMTQEEIPFGSNIERDEMKAMKNMGHYSLTELNERGSLNVRMCFVYLQENMSDEPNVLWTMKLDTSIKTLPSLFRNHMTGVNELILQSGKELCLLNATGKIIWKRSLAEDVASDIFEVDAFNNKKYQMLFNTKNNLCLLDRNGNYVQGYPARFPSAATNKLSVYDYGAKSDYRLFIACADHRIYNYSIYGEKQEGFKPMPVAADVHLPVKYCKVGASDYLVTADKKGKIYAFSRKGDGRIDFKNKLIEDAEEIEMVVGNSVFNTSILYYDRKGDLLDRVSLNDVKEIHKTNNSESTPATCFFDIDRNSIPDLISVKGNLVEAYEPSGTRIFTAYFPEEISASQVKCYTVGPNNYLSIFSEANSTCYIYHVEQKTFRQYKSSMNAGIADLFNDGKAYALVVMGSELKCVRL
jgi:hypothetical protein